MRLTGICMMVALTGLMAGCGQERLSVPQTEVHDVVDNLHGVEIHDPYRWLEGDDKGQMTPAVAKWTDTENAYTRGVLDHIPGRAALEARLRELMTVPSMGTPTVRGGRYFYMRREGDQNQAVLYVRQGIAGDEQVLIDPNHLDKEGLVTLAWYAPSDDGTLLAYGLYRAGDENAVGHIMEVQSRRQLPDELKWKAGGVQWTPDGKGMFYERLKEAKNPYSKQICFHRLGDVETQDAVLFEQYKQGPLATTWGPDAEVDRQARWMALRYWTGTQSNDLWAVNLEQWRQTGKFERKEIITGADALSSGQVIGDTLLMQTTLDAPNGKLVAVDMNNPSRDQWKTLVPERKDATLEGVGVAKDYLVLRYQKDAVTQIQLMHRDGTGKREFELPGLGSGGLSVREESNEAFLSYSSFATPPTIWRMELPGDPATREVWYQAKVPVDPKGVEVKQVWYPSKDGTKVSMFIVHRSGMKLDGNNPALLTGYGGFGISMTPHFWATMFPFIDAGGVYAIPNLRGGGEYGEAWHRAGMLEKKQNVFDDFISAAEYLIREKYTRPDKLAISGGSNGGLLVGAALVQRPDLFRAVVCDVPLLDMLRYQRFLMARYWVPEYGSSEDAKQFAFLLKYSPYQNVRKGVAYPAVLLGAGENDVRVHPSHARKMAALLQADTSSDPREKPVLIWVERDAGHGGGKPLALRVRDETDRRAFVMWQLGMLNHN